MTWIICDYGGVISLPQPSGDIAAVESAAGVTGDGSLWPAYWRHRPAYDRGDVTAAQYWEVVLGRRPTPVQLERIVAADVASWLHPNLASVEAVAELQRRGARLALFSNAPVDLADELASAPWLATFSERFFSCRLNAIKPDAAAYEAVLSGLGAEAGEVIFVDDRQANVDGAAAVGMRAFLFEGPDVFAGLL